MLVMPGSCWYFSHYLDAHIMNDLEFSEMDINKLSIHFVGNRVQQEDLILSGKEAPLNEEIKSLLKNYFTRPFKEVPFYTFYHQSDLHLNETYTYCMAIFDDPSKTHFQSINLAKHLYSSSSHPNIKSGEFYVAYLTDCLVDGEYTDAIGIFKSENKDAFIKVTNTGVTFEVEKEVGINSNKLDKGCLIFNLDKENGYRLVIVDHTNRGDDAQYWKEHFLQAKPRQDDFYHTRNYLQMCRDFAVEVFPEADKIDKLALMSESAKFFQENEVFDKHSFQEKVLREPEIIEAFEDYKSQYRTKNELETFDEFDINPAALKQLKRVFKSVIKLDKNFHIYVHGNRDLIRKGFDQDSGMHFYQIYFKEET